MSKKTRNFGLRSSVLFITMVYMVFGITWIFLSGAALDLFASGSDDLQRWETYKGVLFILATSLLIFMMINRREKQREKLEANLIESEKKYRTIVEASHELIWSTDRNNIITFVNNASENIYGLKPEEMIGRKFTDFAGPEQITEDKIAFAEALKSGADFIQYESKVTNSSGQTKHLLTNCIIERLPAGGQAGLHGTSLDITDRVEIEDKLKNQNRVYALQTNVNQLIVRAKDKDQILSDACRLAVEFGKFKMAWVGLIDPETGKIMPAHSFGDITDYVNKLDISIHEKNKGPIVKAFTDKTYYVSNDVETDSNLSLWKEDCLQKGFHSFGTFPIECRDKIAAVYNIYSGEKNFFGNESTSLLLELAEDISFALEYLEIEKERVKIEESYKNIVEKAPIGIWLQLEGRLSYINPAGYKMLGYDSYHELIGKNIKDIIHSSSHREVNQRLEKLLEGNPVPGIEEKFVRSDGRLIDVMVSAIPFAQDGRKGSQAFFNDLTETKTAQKEANETNERFKLITKATNDALWDWNLETDTMWWNDGFKDLFGYSDDEIEKGIESWTNRIHEDDKERIKNGIETAISAGHDFWFDEYAFRRKDGSYSYVFDRGYILKDSHQKPYRMVGSMIDISFRRKMEEELKASEEKWRSLFENSPSIILTIDSNYNITGVNRSISKRYDSREIIGLNCFELIDPSGSPAAKENLDTVFSSQKAHSFTVKRVTEENAVQHYMVQAIPQIRNSKVDNITLIATDITEKILAEEKEKETNEMLHSLAAHLQTIREEERTMISREIHDQLGQELTALKMDIAFLSKKIEKSREKPDCEGIMEGLRSMSDITDQTINSVRRIARELRPDILDKLGLKDAIEWHAEEFTKRTGIRSSVSFTDTEFHLGQNLDTTIYRIVQEALTNVARHSGADYVKLGLSMNGKNIYLSIEDNGRGITEDEIRNAKSLGLVGIKERAHSVNGQISITGIKNEGTKLNIIIPK